MNTILLSTRYSKSIRVKNKTFVLHLATPEIIEVYGPGISSNHPMILTVKNPEGTEEFEFDYTDDFIWDALKAHKKTMKNKGVE